ncbi:MAG: hypothetical protein QXW70_03765 [Candidatus Anstonellales archaeon]
MELSAEKNKEEITKFAELQPNEKSVTKPTHHLSNHPTVNHGSTTSKKRSAPRLKTQGIYSCNLAMLLEKKCLKKKRFAKICDRLYYLCTKRKRTLSEDNEKFWLWHRLEKEL